MRALFALIFFAVFVGGGISQTPLPDSDPILQGPVKYTIPQEVIDAEIEGNLVVGVHVDKAGQPTAAGIVSWPTWPCGDPPTKALETLNSTLRETVLKLHFSPAIKDGKPVAKDIGLIIRLKNPKLEPTYDSPRSKPHVPLVQGGVINGKAKSLPKPDYPPAAKANHESGAVSIQVIIDETGKVIRAWPLDGRPTLQAAAREAACRAKFSPTTLSGMPVKVTGVITYNFNP